MNTDDWSDDDLLGRLDAALRTEQEVPGALVDAGKAAWTWRSVDAELAALTYDSAAAGAGDLLVVTRSDPRAEAAALRSLTFESATVTIELEVTRDALLGQVHPAGAATVEVLTADAEGAARPGGAPAAAVVEVDEVGWFTVRPVPRAPFRLSYRSRDGDVQVLTAVVDV